MLCCGHPCLIVPLSCRLSYYDKGLCQGGLTRITLPGSLIYSEQSAQVFLSDQETGVEIVIDHVTYSTLQVKPITLDSLPRI